MKTMLTTLICRSLLCLSLTFALTACNSQEAGPVTPLETGIPSALQNARLVYENQEGVMLQPLGQEARLLLAGGKWPRWSPDGKTVACLRGNEVCLISVDNAEVTVLATTTVPKTLVFSADGSEVWYSEGKTVKAVKVDSKEVRTLAEDGDFLEIDSGPDGNSLAATVKSFGYKVMIFDLENNSSRSLGKGCSASLSPDGSLATNNLDGHRQLALVKVADGSRLKTLAAPGEMLTDNQFWSNHPDWVASMDEEHGRVLAHRVSDGKVWQISEGPGADRPDLWIPGK